MSETISVTFEVRNIEMVRGCGALRAMAEVSVALNDLEAMILCGCQIRRCADGRLMARGPQYRDPRTGRWHDAVLLPTGLVQALGRELIDAMGSAA